MLEELEYDQVSQDSIQSQRFLTIVPEVNSFTFLNEPPTVHIASAREIALKPGE